MSRRTGVACGFLLLLAGCLDLPTTNGLAPEKIAAAASTNQPSTSLFPDAASNPQLVMMPADLGVSTPLDADRPMPVDYPKCEGETAPLPDTASHAWAPLTRLTKMDLPRGPMKALEAGCDVLGRQRGGGIYGLEGWLGGRSLTDFLTPTDTGYIELLLMAHLKGWRPGTTGSQSMVSSLVVYDGDIMRDGSTRISLESFLPVEEGMATTSPSRRPKAQFGASISGCQLQTDENDFYLEISNFPLPDGLRLSKVNIKGHISVDEKGFNLTQGILTGYLTEEALIEAVVVLRRLCSAEEKPEVCTRIPPSFYAEGEQGKEVRELFFTILGGADVLYDNGSVTDQCDENCNAVSVCIIVEGESVAVDGLNTCKDEIENGDETDIDCGGYCEPCVTGSRCQVGSDCESGACLVGFCTDE